MAGVRWAQQPFIQGVLCTTAQWSQVKGYFGEMYIIFRRAQTVQGINYLKFNLKYFAEYISSSQVQQQFKPRISQECDKGRNGRNREGLAEICIQRLRIPFSVSQSVAQLLSPSFMWTHNQARIHIHIHIHSFIRSGTAPRAFLLDCATFGRSFWLDLTNVRRWTLSRHTHTLRQKGQAEKQTHTHTLTSVIDLSPFFWQRKERGFEN